MNNGGTHQDYVQFDNLDKERQIRFDMNAICDFEDVAHRSVVDVIFYSSSITMGDVRTLLWAGLKHEDARLTRERVGQLMEDYLSTGGTLSELATAVRTAVNRSRLFVALGTATSPNPQGEAPKASPTQAAGSGDV